MVIAQDYAPDLSKYKDKFMLTPLGLIIQGKSSEAINKLGSNAKERVNAMNNPETALQTGMDFMGGGLLGTIKKIAPKSYSLNSNLKLDSDIPSKDWLLEKRLRAASGGGTGEIGAHIGSSITGGYRGEYPTIPTNVLKEILGLNLEQQKVRESSLNYLTDYMEKNQHLPTHYFGSGNVFSGRKGDYLPLNVEGVREYKPFIMVDQYGQPFVNEGNHRIMVANKLGWENLPIELRYFEGGDIRQGLLNPDLVINYNKTGNKDIFNEELQKYIDKAKSNTLITEYHKDNLKRKEVLNRRLKLTRKK